MAFRITRAREGEHGGARDGDADAVRDNRRVRLLVIGGDIPLVMIGAGVLTRNGVRHPMAEMHARITEPDPRQRGREEHLGLRFRVIGIAVRAREVADRLPQGLEGEDVGDRVGALVCWAGDRVGGARGTLVVRDGGPGFEGVAEDVETRGGVDGGGHGARVQGVADAQGGFQGAVCDAGFGFAGYEVEDRGPCGFGTGAGGGGDGDEGAEGLVYGFAETEGRVDEVEEGGRGVVRVEVHEFCGVDDGAAAHGEEGVGGDGFGEGDGVADGGVLWFEGGGGVDGVIHAFAGEGFVDLFHGVQFGYVAVRDDADLCGAHVLQVHAHFFGAAGSEADA